jgi:hypothetical protein
MFAIPVLQESYREPPDIADCHHGMNRLVSEGSLLVPLRCASIMRTRS